MNETKEKKIFKDNRLIEAYYQYMSVTEYKLISVGLSKIMENKFEIIKESITVEFTVEEFCNLMGIKKVGAYSNIKKRCNEMQNRKVVFQDISQKESDWDRQSWIIRDTYKSGIIKFYFNPFLTDYIKYNTEKAKKEKVHFTLCPLNIILQMNSFYSIRLYELLLQYQCITTRKFSIFKLKSLLGIAKTNYAEYKYFKRKILNPCMKEINSVSNIKINLIEIKKSRKVEEIQFNIYKQLNFIENYITNYENYPKEKLYEFINKLYFDETGHSISYKDIKNFHRNVLIECIEKLELGKFNKVHIEYPKKYLIKTLKNATIDSKYDLTKIRDY